MGLVKVVHGALKLCNVGPYDSKFKKSRQKIDTDDISYEEETTESSYKLVDPVEW